MPAEFVLWVAVVIVVPTALLMLIRPAGRLVFFLLALLVSAAIEGFMELGGPDSPLLILPALPLVIALDAAVAQIIVSLCHFARRTARGQGEIGR
ncbi:MAG TPA: hypothetical protein VGB65_06875 [Allosphingosinicella sp.]|jgi:hypothetical protein